MKTSIQKLRYLKTFTVLFPDFFNNSSYKLLLSLSKKRSAHFRKFSVLFKDLADDIDQTTYDQNRYRPKSDKMKLFIKTFLSSKPKKRFNLSRALLLGSRFGNATDKKVEAKLVIYVYA